MKAPSFLLWPLKGRKEYKVRIWQLNPLAPPTPTSLCNWQIITFQRRRKQLNSGWENRNRINCLFLFLCSFLFLLNPGGQFSNLLTCVWHPWIYTKTTSICICTKHLPKQVVFRYNYPYLSIKLGWHKRIPNCLKSILVKCKHDHKMHAGATLPN